MLDTNIDADAKADMDSMIEQGKALGLDPKDLAGEIDGDLEKRGTDPFNPDKPTGISRPDETPASKPEEQKTPETKPDADQEEEDSEDDESEEDETEEPEEKTDEKKSDEGEDAGKPAADSKKFLTKGEFGKFSRSLKNEFKELSKAINALAQAKPGAPAADAAAADVQEKVDEITEYAQKYKDADGNPLDASALTELRDIIKKSVLKDIPLEKLKGLEGLTPVVSKMADNMKSEEILSDFNREWETEGNPEISKQYPNATAEQKDKAKALLLELATSEKYGFVDGKHDAYPLNYILFKEQEQFKTILFSPKKKTAEGSHLGAADDLDESSDTDVLGTRFEDMTPARAAKINSTLNEEPEDGY